MTQRGSFICEGTLYTAVSTLHFEAVISSVTVMVAQGQSSAIFTSHSKTTASRQLTITLEVILSMCTDECLC